MATTNANANAEEQCREHLERFFASYQDPALKRSCQKALRFLTALDQPLAGKPEGWAAGIVYAVANRGCRPCGVPGILNADLERHFGVSISTVRKRATQVERALEI